MLMKVTPRVKKKQENHLEILGGAVPGLSDFMMGLSPISSPTLTLPLALELVVVLL